MWHHNLFSRDSCSIPPLGLSFTSEIFSHAASDLPNYSNAKFEKMYSALTKTTCSRNISPTYLSQLNLIHLLSRIVLFTFSWVLSDCSCKRKWTVFTVFETGFNRFLLKKKWQNLCAMPSWKIRSTNFLLNKYFFKFTSYIKLKLEEVCFM
jgi:hypothetical protein